MGDSISLRSSSTRIFRTLSSYFRRPLHCRGRESAGFHLHHSLLEVACASFQRILSLRPGAFSVVSRPIFFAIEAAIRVTNLNQKKKAAEGPALQLRLLYNSLYSICTVFVYKQRLQISRRLAVNLCYFTSNKCNI